MSGLAELKTAGWWVDGANSTVRELLGATMDDSGYAFDWLVVDMIERRPRRWVPCNIQICDLARPTTAVSGGPGPRRFEFMVLPGEEPGELDDDDVVWRLLAPWGMDPAGSLIERRAIYTFSARVSRTWRQGRSPVAGDAADQMPPFAGQGLCSGLRDAANLTWKLDEVLQGNASAGLLDTYGSERVVQASAERDFSVDLGRIICIADPEEAAARDQQMVAAATAAGPMAPPPLPPLGPGILLTGDPAAGQLAVQGEVTYGGLRGRLDEVVGRGWLLYGLHDDPRRHLSPSTLRWWSRLGGLGFDCSDASPLYSEWLSQTDAEVVLVRPDFAVFGSAAVASGADGLVRALRQAFEAGS